MVIVRIGPMGCGKTTIGQTLDTKLGWQFYDADDFHPEANKKKMAQGVPLEDQDREPWLEILHKLIRKHLQGGSSMILACSALKKNIVVYLGLISNRFSRFFLKAPFHCLKRE